MNVKINRDGCIGCGVCESICPEVFRMAEDGLAEVYADVTPELESSVREGCGQLSGRRDRGRGLIKNRFCERSGF